MSNMVNILLRHGANIEQRSPGGGAPLMEACLFHREGSAGMIATVEVLLRYGADIHATTDKGVTALNLARECSTPRIVALLETHQ